MFDLPAYARIPSGPCWEFGIAQRARCDTAAEEARRSAIASACLRGETAYGLGLPAIVLDE